VREQGESGSIKPGELGAEAFVGILVLVDGASEICLVFIQGGVLAIGTRLLLL